MTLPRAMRPLPAALLLILSAGCLAPHPDEERPEAAELLGGALREAWSAEATQGEYPQDEAFWGSFGDEVLGGLVVEALAHNHDLAASAERLRAAAARTRVARSARRPQLDANTTYARQQNVFVGLPIPGNSGPLAATFSQWNAGLDLAWELDLWGKLAAAVDAASAELSATAADLAGARLSIAAQVTQGWFQLREADEQFQLAQATLETYERSLDVVQGRFDAGLSGALDLRLAEANVASSRAALVAARRARAVAARQIEVLLGRFPEAELERAGDFGDLPAQVPAGIPAEVLGRRPDLVAAERRMAAAEAAAKQARLDRWPNLALTASVGRTSEDFEDLLDGDFTIWSIAGRLAGPILDGGRRRARVDETLADLRAARASFAGLALRAFFEVENALDAERLLRQRIGHLATAAEAAAAATELADEQYREGLVSIELVLESQRRQFSAESAFLAARRELFQARVDLHVALGGSFGSAGESASGDGEPAEGEPAEGEAGA